MKSTPKRIFPAIILLLGLHPILGSACAILPRDKDEERSRQIVEEAKTATAALKEQADLIFVGSLMKLTFEQETVDGQVLQHHQAFFDAYEEIKGRYPKGQALAFTTNKNRVWVSVGCRPEYWQLPKENGTREIYLVYAKEGKVLRTNHIPTDTQAMSGREEAAFVRGR
jgi:hypothetical protein